MLKNEMKQSQKSKGLSVAVVDTQADVPCGNSQFSDTQIKIILAAERLFAAGSIDSTSLREIAVEADQRNHFAVQYHFESKEGLVRAVFAYRMFQMEKRRGLMLAAAEKSGLLKHARTLLDMLYLPQLELVDSDGRHSYAKFLCQYLLRYRSFEFGDFGSKPPPNLQRVFTLLRECLGDLPEPAAQRRLVSASLVFLNILSSYDDHDYDKAPAVEVESFSSALEDTMAQIEAAIAMPMKKDSGRVRQSKPRAR